MRLVTAETAEQIQMMEALYLESFPEIERKPFAFMLQKRAEGEMEFLALEGKEGMFQGLAFMVLCEDMVLLDYFAIASSEREKGLGSEALKLLKEYYRGRRFLLEIECLDAEAENAEQRKRRKAFYLRNGMKPMPFLVNLFGVEMEVLTCDCEVAYDEYHRLYEIFGSDMAGKVTLVKK